MRAPGTATYTGNAQLWQEETSIKGASIVLDDKTGDLTAGGGVTTVTVRDSAEQEQEDRTRPIDCDGRGFPVRGGRPPRHLYRQRAHEQPGRRHDGCQDRTVSEAVGCWDSDLERAEAYDNVTLRDQNRTTTGARLTYTTADQRYVVTGAPVKVVDECRRETIGSTLTYLKSAETITIDGNEQTRTQTKGSGQCP